MSGGHLPVGETSLMFGEDLLDPSILSLRNVGGHVCTPIFQVGDTVTLGDVGSQVSTRTLQALYSFCSIAHVVSYLRKQGGTRSRDLCLLSWGIDMPAFLSHSISHACVSKQSFARQAPVHGGADRPPSFQADPRSASHFILRSFCDTLLRASSSLPFSLPDRSAKGVDALSHT